jgi:hypothetical protein
MTFGIVVVAAIGVGATPHRILHRFSSHDTATVGATDAPTATPSDARFTPGTAATGSASPSSAPTLFGVESVDVGDCLLWNPNGVAVSIHKVPCDKAHRAEVTELIDVSHRFTTWPGEAAIQKAIEQVCPDALQRYAPARPADPGLVGWGVMPLEQAWSQGDHHVVCTAESSPAGLVTGSVKSASPVKVSAG